MLSLQMACKVMLNATREEILSYSTTKFEVDENWRKVTE